MGRLGGKRSPREPDVVISPSENFSLYPSFLRIGKSNPPRAIIVTPLAPVKAVKKAQITRETMATPPGSHPRAASAKRKSLAGAFDSAII